MDLDLTAHDERDLSLRFRNLPLEDLCGFACGSCRASCPARISRETAQVEVRISAKLPIRNLRFFCRSRETPLQQGSCQEAADTMALGSNGVDLSNLTGELGKSTAYWRCTVHKFQPGSIALGDSEHRSTLRHGRGADQSQISPCSSRDLPAVTSNRPSSENAIVSI